MSRLILNNFAISFENLLGDFGYKSETELEEIAIDFCKEWMSGKPHFVVHTSGSTGTPKSIEIKRSWMELSARSTCTYLGLHKSDQALVCLHPKYIAGKMMLVRAMTIGMDAIMVAPEANPFAKHDMKQIDFVALVPLQLQAILDNPRSTEALNKAKAIIVGGAPLSATLRAQCQLVTAPIYLTFGMTETVSHLALQRINGEFPDDYFTVLPHFKIRQDEAGCLEVISEITNNNWLKTNDIVQLISETKFRWLGRTDFVINSGGIKILIENLESLIEAEFNKQGIINRFVITSIPDDLLGEKVILVMEGENDVDKTVNFDFLGKYEKPKLIKTLASFPKTNTDKIDRQLIKKLIQ